jgi:hypothetical protein
MTTKNSVDSCQLIELGKIHNRAGNITVVEGNNLIPFPVKRLYYLYDIPGGAERGGHAHKNLYQLIVAASGSFNVELNDGQRKKTIYLNHPTQGLLIKPGIWRELNNFSSGSICLVLVSEMYDQSDYIRDYNEFINYRNDSSFI